MHDIWNGKAIYTGSSEEVWHHIGVYVGDRKLTSADILSEAGLDYEVSKLPMFIQAQEPGIGGALGGVRYVPSKNFALCREGVTEDPEGAGNPVQLGTVTDYYKILQNRDAFKPFDPLVEQGLIDYTAAGALANGARVWIAAKLNQLKTEDTIVREYTVNGKKTVDTVEAYWLLYNGHDGMTALSTTLTAIRPVCFNTVSAALGDWTFRTDGKSAVDAKGRQRSAAMKARHAENVGENLAKAVASLEKTHAEFGKLMNAYRAMAAVKLTDAKIERFFKLTFPVVEGEEWSTRRKNQIEDMTRLALEGTGNTGGSVWDLFNGVTEWIDHKSAGDDMAMINSSWFGTRKDQRQDAFRAALKLSDAA
jgi:phage/plasmid-like protein (TIGR03299 family)